MRKTPLDAVAFVLSLALLAFLSGMATEALGWFPSSLLRRAWTQVRDRGSVSSGVVDPSQNPAWTEPRVYRRQGVRLIRPAAYMQGTTLLTSGWEFPDGWSSGLRLIDATGKVLHQWRVRPSDIFSDTVASSESDLGNYPIHGSHLFPNGDVLVNLSYLGIARIDACGNVRWRQSARSYHHSIARSERGGFWVPGVIRDLPAESPAYPEGYPGLEGPIHHDLIVKLSEDGDIIREIRILDVLFDNGLERFIPHARLDRFVERPYGKDITHLNDVESLSSAMAGDYPLFEAGDLLVSLRNQHLVFVLDPDSGRVKWHAHTPFIHQHDPDFIGRGWIGVFDNNQDGTDRGTMLGGSRILLLQPHTDSMRIAFPSAGSEPFYTDVKGKWQFLDNGDLLLTEAQAGRVVEVDPQGRTVWEWIHAATSDSTVASVNEGTRYGLTAAEVASWPCTMIGRNPARPRRGTMTEASPRLGNSTD